MIKNLLVAAALVVGMVIGVAGYMFLFADTKVLTGIPPVSDPRMSFMMEEKCMACHTKDFDLPFYAELPGIKSIIEKDYVDGIRAFDLGGEFDEHGLKRPVGEVALAKIEWVIQNDTMPPAKFTAVHWKSKVTAEDKTGILGWVAVNRAKHYASVNTAPEHINEPVQPIPDSIPTTPAKVALGNKLFHDNRLSGDNTVSCATCHDVEKAGTDNARFSEGIRKQLGDVNAPTVFNAAFYFRQFWDGRAADLHEQVAGPPFNPVEMDSKDWQEIMDKLLLDDELTAAFTLVYADGWTPDNIQDAIAEYEKTLITPNSPFDKWLKGDEQAITPPSLKATGASRPTVVRHAM